MVRRNRTRDFLDVVALAERLGVGEAAATLSAIDDFSADQTASGDGVASQVARQLAAVAIRDEPWGPLARRIEEIPAAEAPYGAGPLMGEVIAGAREDAERAEVAAEIRRLVSESGLTRADFARRIGTSPSRLSTYLAGSVTPSASLLVRMRR